MAFITDEAELQALLNACSSTREWEMLTESILIFLRLDFDGVCSTFGATGTHNSRDTGKFVELSFKFCSFSGLDVIVPFA